MIAVKCVVGLLALVFAGVALGDGKDKKEDAKEVVINIEGKGGQSKYIEQGKTKQEPVTVTVGQKVTWKNMSKAPHTATSDKMKDNKPLWTTKNPIKGKADDKVDSDSVTFDQKLFEALGGKEGEDLKVDYHCEIHEEMKAQLVLKMPAKKDK
jgi:plastocyanin